MTGSMTRISRMRLDTDGMGVTTLVAMYGCPLRCKYCINGYNFEGEFVRANFTVEELIKELSIDEAYFKMTGGGVVFGGGEPLLQADYLAAVCKEIAGKYDIRIETSLYATWEQVNILIPYVTQWIVDIKDVNPKIYKTYTGKNNKIVLENLEKLSKCVDKSKILVRVPHIPEYNKDFDVFRSKLQMKRMGLKVEEFTYRDDV